MIDASELVPEALFARQVLQYATLHDWTAMHISDSRRSYSAGFPDIHAIKGPRFLYAELKPVQAYRKKNHDMSWAQFHWWDVILAGGGEWYLWTPAMWDEIEHVLGPRP